MPGARQTREPDGVVLRGARVGSLPRGDPARSGLVGCAVMMRKRRPEQDRPTRLRVTAAGVAGLVVAIVVGAAVGWQYAVAAGWTVAAAVFTAWTWRVIGGMDPAQTAAHATREDPAGR